MKLIKKPLLRIPLLLTALGILERIITFIVSFIWVQIQRSQGPNPITGAYEISSGYVTEIMTVIGFVLFWAAGWKFVRGLTRKQIFFSATIMSIWYALLLGLEQWTMATSNYDLYFSLVYRLWVTLEGMSWASQLLVRIFGDVTLPVMMPAVLTPYLYLLFGKHRTHQEEAAPTETV